MEDRFDLFFLKLLNHLSNTRLVATLYVANFFLCTIIFMIFESHDFFNALWWCTVTWFTVGYGDLYPQSIGGKLFTMYTIISSHVLILVLTTNIVIKISRFRNKRHVRKHDFCPTHRELVAETIKCKECSDPLSLI